MAKRRKGRYPKAFRQMAVERMKGCENIVALSEELGVHRRLLYKWRDKVGPGRWRPEGLREGETRGKTTLRKENHQLKRVLANKVLEVDFFKGALQKVEARRQRKGKLWREGIYDQIREVMSMQGSLSIERMCQLAQVSRAGFYRSLAEQMPVEEEMEVRSAISRSLSSTGAATAIGGSQPSCGGAECW